MSSQSHFWHALLLLLLFSPSFSFSSVIKKKFDLDQDHKKDLITFNNSSLSIHLVKSPLAIGEKVFVYENSKYRFEYQYPNKIVTLVAYNPKFKYKLIYKKAKTGQKYSLILAKKFLLKPQFLLNGAECSGKPKYVPAALDLEKCGVKLNTKSCSATQSDAIQKAFDQVSLDLFQDVSKDKFKECFSKIYPKPNQNNNLLQEYFSKIEQLQSGNSQLEFICLDKKLDQKAEICKKARAFSIVYPDQISICFDKTKNPFDKANLSEEIAKHELLHSKGLELNEAQIVGLFRCQFGNDYRPAFSDTTAEDIAEQGSSDIASGIDFNPGKEYEQINPPQFPSESVVDNEFGDGIFQGADPVQISERSPILTQSSGLPYYLNNVFDKVIPRAEANQVIARQNTLINSKASNTANLSSDTGKSVESVKGVEVIRDAADQNYVKPTPKSGKMSVAAKKDAREIIFKKSSANQKRGEADNSTNHELTETETETETETSNGKFVKSVTRSKVEGALTANSNQALARTEKTSPKSSKELTQLMSLINNKPAKEVRSLLKKPNYRGLLSKNGIIIIFNSENKDNLIQKARQSQAEIIFIEDLAGIIRKE